MECRNGNIHDFSNRGIGEYRLDWGPGYRVYMGRDGDKLIILLGGGTKRTQEKDIKMVVMLWAEYKDRKQKLKKNHFK